MGKKRMGKDEGKHCFLFYFIHLFLPFLNIFERKRRDCWTRGELQNTVEVLQTEEKETERRTELHARLPSEPRWPQPRRRPAPTTFSRSFAVNQYNSPRTASNVHTLTLVHHDFASHPPPSPLSSSTMPLNYSKWDALEASQVSDETDDTISDNCVCSCPMIQTSKVTRMSTTNP
jgi:hypothetical protein